SSAFTFSKCFSIRDRITCVWGMHASHAMNRMFRSRHRPDQRQVSLAVSEGIVDRLEIVDIEIEEQNALFITTREFQLLRNGSQKTTTIKETGEIVGNGQ